MAAETKKASVEEPQEEGNIDKIRDILFGQQVRESERRFAKIEDRFNQEMAVMREENKKRLSALEEYIKGEVKSLTERLAAEQNSRTDSVKELSGELKNLSHNVDKRVAQLGDQAVKNESDLRQQILTQSKNLGDEMHKKQAEVIARLESESSEIRSDKADRSALADLFTEMAMRISGDFKLPGGKE